MIIQTLRFSIDGDEQDRQAVMAKVHTVLRDPRVTAVLESGSEELRYDQDADDSLFPTREVNP